MTTATTGGSPRWLAATVLLAGLATFAAPAAAQDADLPSLFEEPPARAEERARLAAARECVAHGREVHGDATLAARQAAMQRELLAYQALAEEALAARAGAIRLLHELREKIDRDEPLSGQDQINLKRGARAMLDQRAALYRVSQAHECWLDAAIPTDATEADIHAKGIVMSLSAALVLYDNYLSAISLYRSDPALRKHLNRADKGYEIGEGELNRIAVSFASPDNRARVRRGLRWYEAHGRPDAADPADPGYRYLVQLVEQSPSHQIVRHASPLGFVGNLAGFFGTLGFDTLLGLKDEGIHVTSLLFGNAVGLVETRRGKLDGRADVRERVASALRAGDILLEKTPFRLTDAFIPGHWGHVAVWIGTEAELRALGIWDDPVVRRHHERIRAGRGVVEALRSGVEMNPLTQFLNVDDVAVLHQTELPAPERAAIVLQALRQVGKAYDFNFDVESTDRIVCSELVYHSYAHLQWPTARHLGRVTISPDNVAVRATGDGPLQVAVLYHDGAPIDEARRDFMARLVKAPIARVARR